jgi:mycothiol synthase
MRGAGRDQLPGLNALLDAAREEDRHQPLGEHKWLDLVHGNDFAAVIAGTPDDLTGYAHLSRHSKSGWGLEIVVHPAHRTEGIREHLARRALDVVADAGGGRVHFWVFCRGEEDDELARRLGMKRGRDLLYVCVDLPVDLEVSFPKGISIRGFDPERDEQAWLDVNNRAFAGHPEQADWDLDTLRRRMSEAWFDPQDLLLAVDEAGIAGFNWTKLYPGRGVGEIYVIGVDPSRQGTKLGKSLTLAGLEHMARRGMRRCCLYVDDANRTALHMYRRIGFEVDHLDRAYIAEVVGR